MKQKITSILWFAAALFAMTALFPLHQALAQCPDDSYGIPPSVALYPWTAEAYPTTIDGCNVTIYCC